MLRTHELHVRMIRKTSVGRAAERPRAEPIAGSGLAPSFYGNVGRPRTTAFLPARRVGFSELFGGSFDGPLQLWFALPRHGGAPSPRPATRRYPTQAANR